MFAAPVREQNEVLSNYCTTFRILTHIAHFLKHYSLIQLSCMQFLRANFGCRDVIIEEILIHPIQMGQLFMMNI